MTDEFTPLSRTQFLIQACKLLGTSLSPENPEAAKRLGAAELLCADVFDDLDVHEIGAIEYALTAIFWRAQKTAGTELLRVDFDSLALAIGCDHTTEIVLHRHGFLKHPRGNSCVWQNFPIGKLARVSTVTFTNLRFTGQDFAHISKKYC